jgi:hypothetical protein
LSDLEEKFQNGFKIIENFIDKNNLKEFINYPIILSSGQSPENTKRLDKIKIIIGTQKYPIIKERCNSSLEKIFKKYKY